MSDSIRILTPEALEEEPDPTWLVDDYLMQDTLATLLGTKASYKTFMALDMGLSVATGMAWQGQLVEQGNVLHVVGEGGRGIKAREHAWLVAHGLDIADLHQHWRCTVKAVDLMQDAELLIGTIEAAFGKAGVSLLVIDTFARNCRGDENSTVEMKKFVEQLDIIRQRWHCCILLLHHTNRGGTFRGNSAVDGALDSIFILDKKGDKVTVHCDKQKDAEEPDDIVMRAEAVPLGENVRDGLVLHLDTSADPEGEKLLELLDPAGEKGMLREECKKLAVKSGVFGESKFNATWKRLKDAGRLVTVDGLAERPRGTMWTRNLALLDLSFS